MGKYLPRLAMCFRSRLLACIAFLAFVCPRLGRAEAMLQYFNTEYREITLKIQELAEVGYTSLWLPPPCKGSGGLSVGYDLWDRFDLGSKDQRGTLRTFYGTEGELQELIETAHRFGIRIYFDNITNHNAFDIPGYNETTPIDLYPGFVPEDFHLRRTQDGFYRKWDNTRDWNDAWQVQNLGLSDLVDIAHENPNTNHGFNEGDDMPKAVFVRQPNNPEYYLDTDLPQIQTGGGVTVTVYPFANKEPFSDVGYVDGGNTIGANNGRFDFKDLNNNGQHDVGEASESFTDTGVDPLNPSRQSVGWGFGNGRYDMGNPIAEDVNSLLIRSGRWLVDRTKCDGYRLDAVKHVPDYFFGQQGGADRDRSSAGFIGATQEQFNLARGFLDWDNHRDSVFDTEKARDDAMMFGEHLGEPPGFGGYFDAGMRLVDNPLRNQLNDKLGNPSNGLNGYDQPGAGGFSPELGVTHAQSHDSDYAARRELQHAYYFTRAGLPLIYTDGNNKAGLLEGSGGAFPRHANTPFLGQWGDGRIPNVVYLHNHFARGYQLGRWSDADFVAYERIDKRENGGMTDADGVTMLFMMNDNYASGQGRSLSTSFPNDAYLYNYSTYNGGFYKYAGELNQVVVPPGGYFAFSWRSPEQPIVSGSATGPITILQNGSPAGLVSVERKDGRNGDPGYNPYGLPDANATDYKYSIQIPRVTNGANITFLARADASAENILMELDGGVDINSHLGLGPTSGDKRDHPPALSTDVFLGYEQMQFVRRFIEKFAATDTARNVIGSFGAETWAFTVGTGGFTRNNGAGTNAGASTATFIYHDPENTRDIGGLQFSPAPASAAGSAITVKVKTGYQFQVDNVRLYYTTDGSAPEGSGGSAQGATQVVVMAYEAHGNPDGANVTDWWTGTIPAQPAGTVVRYKIGTWKNSDVGSIFPSGPAEVDLKRKAETQFQITGFNATTAKVRTHNDYSEERTGLAEGFHVLRTRAFLNRGGRASIYNTWTQTFYYDAETPQGEIKFPTAGENLGGTSYGAVVRTNRDVSEVWYSIADSDATNDDSATSTQNGNGSGPEPFTDSDSDGTRDANDPFVDINGNGTFDANLSSAWQRANEVTPSLAIGNLFPKEWRFTYRNIPSSGTATLKVRLFEISSTRNLTLSAGAAHVTELTRTVNASGPNLRSFVAYPQQDGQTVGEGYVMKVRFTNSLGDGLSESDLRGRFSVKAASERSGENIGAKALPAQTLPIVYNSAPGYHDFQFALPNLYNGNADFLHTIEVTLIRPGNSSLVATRLVSAFPAALAPFVSVINPPEFDSDGKRYEIVLPDVPTPTAQQRQFTIEVDTDSAAQSVAIVFTRGTGTTALIGDGTPNPRIEGDHKFWRFLWSGMTAGEYTFEAQVDTNGTPASIEARDIRNASVVLRQQVNDNPADSDDDDDGLSDAGETTVTALPGGDPNAWTNAQVHVSFAFGSTNPRLVDSDGDGLPDGLEVGWESASDVGTNVATDTNGDGFPNFLGDTDPPRYNVPGNSAAPAGYELYAPWAYDFSRARTDLIAGTVTSPNRADSDDDGLKDGVEDFNRNGRVETASLGGSGDVATIHAHPPTFRGTSRIDRSRLPAGSIFLETDPNASDTDGDESRDGSEDADGNGRVSLLLVDLNATDVGGNYVVLGPLDESGALGLGKFSDVTFALGTYKSSRVSKAKLAAQFPKTQGGTGHQIGIIWTETDPCDGDSDGDGLPDGWEQRNGLDPLDGGTAISLRTGKAAIAANGGTGDPDSDGLNNTQEYINGSDPRQPDTGVPPPANSIVIGPQTPVVTGGISNAKEFTDWTADDVIVLDEQDGDGSNNGGSDVYHAYDGFDSSRDLVAFYAHDGGDPAAGGDGNFYFRVDLADLLPFAEDGRLDIYVVVNVGNPGFGERSLPDDVDTMTTMGWQAVVACYSGNNGRVYVDTDAANNSTAIGQATPGVVIRDQNVADGFKKAYFRSDLDAVEFSISRKALKDAGWNGLNAADLIYQVFTTKDGTQNNPVGAGDIGGRGDIRDTIYDDYIASDYYADQASLRGAGSKLQSYFGRSVSNDRGRSAKLISLVHGNQHIVPGSEVQAFINTATGAGYYRPLDAHQAFGVPLTMHLTPTLASAIQWASADPVSPRQYRDGPAFNARIRSLAAAGTVQMLGSTFSDHILDYFPADFNAANVSMARDYLNHFYGPAVSDQVLWNPERVADGDLFPKISALGFNYSFVDQQRHIFKWFGRETSLSDAGYRLNQINGVKCFVINDNLNGTLFENQDNGVSSALRRLLLRKARSSTQDQVIVAFSNWEAFASPGGSDRYDANVRWLASHPWVKVVTPQQIAAGAVDLSIPPDGAGDTWGSIDRGFAQPLAKVQHDFLDHATQENYDNWYNGQLDREEGLRNKRFDIRPGVQLSAARKFGEVGVDGVSNEAWGLVSPLATNSSLGRLARVAAFASVFESAFHNQTNNDTAKFSTGAYIYPDISSQQLASFAKVAQAQFRTSAVYQRVATWAAQAAAGVYAGGPQKEQNDVDLDGEDEYLLFNDRIFGVFERLGGRMTGAWVRDLQTGHVHQCVGNPMNYSGSETEQEGINNTVGASVDARRMSAFRDQYYQVGAAPGTNVYVNTLYTVTPVASGVGWRLASGDGAFFKEARIETNAPHEIQVYYSVTNASTLYIRNGLSPQLEDLLLNGQQNLALPPSQDTFTGSKPGFHVVNRSTLGPVRASILMKTTNAFRNPAAVDRDAGATFDTINMRNLAQTQQTEFRAISLAGLSLLLEAGTAITADGDGDTLPDGWELSHGMSITNANGINGAFGDLDGDGSNNQQEYVFGGDPANPADANLIRVQVDQPTATSRSLTFATRAGRLYRIQFANSLSQTWVTLPNVIIGNGSNQTWTDDGSQTGTAPSVETKRFYRVQASVTP